MVTPRQDVGINVAKGGESGTVTVYFTLSEGVSVIAEYLKSPLSRGSQFDPKPFVFVNLVAVFGINRSPPSGG